MNFLYLFKYLECGHFCLNYVLKKEEIKNKVCYPKKMMSLGLMKRVLSEYFNHVKCYKVEGSVEDFIDYKRFITLINVGKKLKHYVVVERVEEEYVYYYDPLFLRLRKIKIKKFNDKWSKYCCFFFKKSNC